MPKPKIIVVNDSRDCGESYGRPFTSYGECINDTGYLDTNPDDVILVVFTGGHDVTPAFYGEQANPQTGNLQARDVQEAAIFDKAVKLKKNIAGICRGSQFICAMSGGKLVQHVTNHGGNHNVRTDDGRLIEVTSTRHHQAEVAFGDV